MTSDAIQANKVNKMKHVHYTEVDLEHPQEPGVKNIKVRWLISKKDGAQNFAMRLFEIKPGGNSPLHQHEWEHEVFILEGEGTVAGKEGEKKFKPGDAIFVTGELGGSLAGRHLEFEPRLAEARWLAEHFSIHAMIDLSDGLAGDLRHVLKAGRVGAELLADSIPVSRAAKLRARGSSSAKPPLAAALTDGEDFELLFTVASQDAVPLLDAWKRQFPKLALTCIGKITANEGVMIRDQRGARPLTDHGYVHFA